MNRPGSLRAAFLEQRQLSKLAIFWGTNEEVLLSMQRSHAKLPLPTTVKDVKIRRTKGRMVAFGLIITQPVDFLPGYATIIGRRSIKSWDYRN